MVSKLKVTVCSDDPDLKDFAEKLAQKLMASGEGDFILKVFKDGLLLTTSKNQKGPSLRIDFAEGALDFRRRFGQKGGDLILRAAGALKDTRESNQILDLTFGLGRDSFILANKGWNITAIERSPILFEMALEGLKRARQIDKTSEIAGRIELSLGEASDFLNSNKKLWDVIIYDPMFPAREKKSLPKKEMQILHELIGNPENEFESENLAALALTRTRRLVIKRPLKAPDLVKGVEPTIVFKSGSTRFDVYKT